MQSLRFRHTAQRRLSGTRGKAIIGVVASGDLEVLLERVLPDAACEVEISTPLLGYDETWKAVIAEFIARSSPGGLRISINDGGARPDTVFLRLLQGSALMETA
ncbi:MAG TPA: malonate decarboxylase acyl carrier protein [Steroidobacteraceae bacterium]|nr:malonate decarboxylase acyl carrier protein [Steroidobacteraceae bacterium]